MIDKEGTGILDDDRFWNIPGNPFVDRVKAVLDRGNKGHVTFDDFMVGLNQVATDASQDEKMRFLFKIYDTKNDGVISNGELFQILTLIIDNQLSDLQKQQLVERTLRKADLTGDGLITYDEFKEMMKGLEIVEPLEIIPGDGDQ